MTQPERDVQINISGIPVAGVGGLGLVAMAILVAVVMPGRGVVDGQRRGRWLPARNRPGAGPPARRQEGAGWPRAVRPVRGACRRAPLTSA